MMDKEQKPEQDDENQSNQEQSATTTRTEIYKLTRFGEDRVGYIGSDDRIYKVRWESGVPIGRIQPEENGVRIFRDTQYDEKELGIAHNDGTVRSHGLFEGGELGWVDPDGVVIQGGLILGEEEVGRVEGPRMAAAAGALLLLFLPEDAEANREMTRRDDG